MSYIAKYKPGAITNSMLEAAESCELKFWTLYLQRAELEHRYEKVLDAMSLGVLVHEIIEQYPQEMKVAPVATVMAKVKDWNLTPAQRNIVPQFMTAVDMTQANGQARGRTEPYTQPTWTTFWKQNYGALDAAVLELNETIMGRKTWLCDIEPMTYLLRATLAVSNYRDLLPEINAGMKFRSVEHTFHHAYGDQVLAGTIDREDETALGDIITDYKTGEKKYTPAIVHNLNQMQLYAWAKMQEGRWVSRQRIVSLERKEIITVDFNLEAHGRFMQHRLPRLVANVKRLRETHPDDLSVLAGRSFAPGCPCALARLKPDDPFICKAVFLEG